MFEKFQFEIKRARSNVVINGRLFHASIVSCVKDLKTYAVG